MRRMQRTERRGFTLIEILVVIAIIATLATAVVMSIGSAPDEAKVARVQSDINVMESALERYRLDMGRYPEEEEGLAVLVTEPETEEASDWKGPYLKRLQKDPWKNDYVYVVPGENNPASFDIFSYGANGEEGGEGEYDAEIGNWVVEEDELGVM